MHDLIRCIGLSLFLPDLIKDVSTILKLLLIDVTIGHDILMRAATLKAHCDLLGWFLATGLLRMHRSCLNALGIIRLVASRRLQRAVAGLKVHFVLIVLDDAERIVARLIRVLLFLARGGSQRLIEYPNLLLIVASLLYFFTEFWLEEGDFLFD